MNNIIVVTFNAPSKSYQALSVLKELAFGEQLSLKSAAVVERQADGQPLVRDGVEGPMPVGTAFGGLIGGLIGALAGPAGAVVGWSTGTIAGVTGDGVAAVETTSLLSTVAERVPAGTTALIAEVDEDAVEVLDGAMGPLGGVVARQSTADVRAEIQAAEEARRAAAKEAKRKEREADRLAREQERTERHNEFIDDLREGVNRVENLLEGKRKAAPTPSTAATDETHPQQ